MAAGRFVAVVLILAGLFFLVPGIWAFVDTESFYDNLAPWEPYNKHFIHDIGAFQIGIGVALLLALVRNDAKLVALGGAASAAIVHVLSHITDHDHGGKDTDIPVFGFMAVLLVVAFALQWISADKRDA
jgi:uncharacterized membrane protein